MTVIAPQFPFSHRIIYEYESNKIVVLASKNIQYHSEFTTVVTPINRHSKIEAICDYYKNAKQIVTLAIDSKHDRVNAIRALKDNFFGCRVQVLDIANQKKLPSPKIDGLAYLYCAFEITRSSSFAVLAAKRALRLMPLVFNIAEELVEQYISDQTLISFAVRAIERQIEKVEQRVEVDFKHTIKAQNWKVNRLQDLSNQNLSLHPTLAIYAATGTGKTENVIAPIARRASSNNRVVYISNLIALVDQFCEKTGAVSYQEQNQRIFRDANAIGVVINSLWKPHLQSMVYEADVVIIDEFEKVLKTVTCSDNSRTMQADKVFNALCLILRNAPRVIIADADLTDISLDFIKKLRGGLTLVGCCENPYHGMNAIIKDKNTFLQDKELKKLLFADKVILFDSLKTLKETIIALGYVNSAGLDCEKAALADGVLVIHGDNKGMSAQAGFLANPNDRIENYKAIIASPCVGAGFSITKSYTDIVHVVCDGTYIPRELVNFARRFRTASTLSFAVKEVTSSQSQDWVELEPNFSEKEQEKEKFERQKQKLNSTLPLSLFFTLRKMGFDVKCITQSHEKQKNAKDCASKRKNEFNKKQILAVIDGKDLTSEEAKPLLMHNKKTSKDLASLERFNMKRFYSLQKIVENDVIFHKQFNHILFAHIPCILNTEQLKKLDIFSSSIQSVALFIFRVLFQYYDFKDERSKLFLRKGEHIDIVNELYQHRGLLNPLFPSYFSVPKGVNSYKATRYIKLLCSKLGLDVGRYSPQQEKARISMTHYAKMYKAYLLGSVQSDDLKLDVKSSRFE